ncbi:MAG: hypothetical protein HONDAALG_03113 [Gammaproteobacteria bacterium]|nr:hypothetical protein [Gammaproteobacteria bacterium]
MPGERSSAANTATVGVSPCSRPHHLRWLHAALVTLAVLLPRAAAALTPEEVRARLDADLSQCTQRYGFDPAARDLPERALAPGERAWRECAYEGVQKHMIPNSTIPDVYLQLIGEDRMLTDRLDRGEITRAQRRQRLDQLIERIRRAERERSQTEQQRLTDYMDHQLDEAMQVRHRLDPF